MLNLNNNNNSKLPMITAAKKKNQINDSGHYVNISDENY